MPDLCAHSIRILLASVLLTTGCSSGSEQLGQGPRVVIDEAHNNFHTAVGTYEPFARVLTCGGYVVERGTVPLPLPDGRTDVVLVIADAQPPASA